MKIAALILGILGGLAGLGVAATGEMFVGLFSLFGFSAGDQALAKLVLWGLPIIGLIGAGMAIARPKVSGILMLVSAAGWLLVGARYGNGINFVTGTTLVLNGVAGILALLASYEADPTTDYQALTPPASDRGTGTSTLGFGAVGKGDNAESGMGESAAYDRKKWLALVRYDPDIATVAKQLEPLGEKWIDECASSYLVLNDKAYLPKIVERILLDHQAEQERKRTEEELQRKAEDARRAEEELQRELQRRAVREAWRAVEETQARDRQTKLQQQVGAGQRKIWKLLIAVGIFAFVGIGGLVWRISQQRGESAGDLSTRSPSIAGSHQAIIFLKSVAPGPTEQATLYFSVIQPDGTGERKLNIKVTDPFAEIRVAARAPLLLFIRPTIQNVEQSRGTTDDLILYNVITDESKLVIQMPHGTSVSSLSEDGSVLVFAETDGFDSNYGCCVAAVAALNTQTEAKIPIVVNIAPNLKTIPALPNRFSIGKMALSPDGEWLGLRRTYYKSWPHAALLVHRPTKATYQLGQGSDSAFITDVGRDGALFTISQSEDGPTNLYLFDFSTKSARLLATGGYLGKLSPDGRRSAYLMKGPKNGQLQNQDLWVIDQAGRTTQIAKHVAGDFAWSPDGMSLVYTMFDAERIGPRTEWLWITTLDGLASRKLTSGNFNAPSHPIWISY